MAHPSPTVAMSEQQILNAVYNPSVSALQVDLTADAITISATNTSPDAGLFRVSAFQADPSVLLVSAIRRQVTGAISDAGTPSLVFDSAAGGQTMSYDSIPRGLNPSNLYDRLRTVSGGAGGLGVLKVGVETDGSALGGTKSFATSAGIAVLSAIKTTADGRIYGWALGNPAGVDQYLQIFYASATSAVSLGSTVPDMSVYVPTLRDSTFNLPQGVSASNGITIAVTSTAAGNTAGASGMRINLFYL